MNDNTLLELLQAPGEKMLGQLPDSLRRFIRDANKWFLGGSRRFGYAMPDSDWDFVVYRPEVKGAAQLPADVVLSSLHLRGEGYNTGHVANFKVLTAQGTVNCIVVDDLEEYNRWGLAAEAVLRLGAIGVPVVRDVSILVHELVWEAAGCVN